MQTTQANLGIATADAENVAVQFIKPNLILTFIDWREELCKLVFNEVLAFRWQEFDEQDLRDDETYEVVDSEWLKRQARLFHPRLLTDYPALSMSPFDASHQSCNGSRGSAI